MLYFKNNEFYVGGLSYRLPEDICIITNFERSLNDGFVFKNLDQTIMVSIETGNINGEEYFNSAEFQESNFAVEEIQTFGYADIEGISAIYSSEYKKYFEVRLNLPRPVDNVSVLIILVEIGNELNINRAINQSIVKDLLLSLRKDLSAPTFLL